jgi:hypothetical protein
MASRREPTPSLRYAERRWVFTVLMDRNSACEISSLVMCDGRKHSTARSLSVSETLGCSGVPAGRGACAAKRSRIRLANPA